MKRSIIAAAAVALGMVGLAQAHTLLKSAEPANNSTVEAPSEIKLTFSKPAKLASLTLSKDGGEATAVESLPKESAATLAIPMKTLEPGKYVLSYRVMGADNHLMNGSISFTVK